MCVIIFKGKGIACPTDELLLDCFTHNPDGWGIMWHDSGTVATVKGYGIGTLFDALEFVPQDDREIFYHFRYATHGEVSMSNTHPFEIGSTGIYMMHNGIIPIESNRMISDTANFVKMITQQLENCPELLFDEGWQNLVLSFIGDSRLSFLTSDGRSVIITDRNWKNWQGLLLSNTYAWSMWKEEKIISDKPVTIPSLDKKVEDIQDRLEYMQSLVELDKALGWESSKYDYKENTLQCEVPSLEDILTLSYEKIEELVLDKPYKVIDSLFEASMAMMYS